jgi:hypothetical protein
MPPMLACGMCMYVRMWYVYVCTHVVCVCMYARGMCMYTLPLGSSNRSVDGSVERIRIRMWYVVQQRAAVHCQNYTKRMLSLALVAAAL